MKLGLAPVLFAGVLGAAQARATGPAAPADDPKARQFFEVGAEAYAKGQYLLAIEAFEQAYAVVKRPGLLFSLGQAHQRQFRATGEAPQLQAAIELYRRYLAADGSGARRQEALTALASLTPLAERLSRADKEAPQAVLGKLLLSSRTPGVTVKVNDEAVERLPTSLQLPNGDYVVVAEAPGFAPLRQVLQVTAGVAVPLSIELSPLPARLLLSGPAGAEAFIDGRSVGFLPLPPLTLSAGQHWLGLRKAGRRTHSESVEVRRGETATRELELDVTTQRTSAYVVGAAGLLSLTVTGVFVGLAFDRDSVAKNLEQQRVAAQQGQGELDHADGERLNSAVDARDRFRTLGIAGGVLSAGLVASAVVLYLADSPEAPHVPASSSASRSDFHVEAAPIASGSLLGAVVSGRF